MGDTATATASAPLFAADDQLALVARAWLDVATAVQEDRLDASGVQAVMARLGRDMDLNVVESLVA